VNRRHLVLGALALVALSAVSGVGSVSSTTADRGVSVAVADDGEAYLGIEFGAVVDNGTQQELVVSNHVSTGDLTVTVDGTPGIAAPGDPAEFIVPCDSTVDITAVDSGVRIEATRSVDCPVTVSSDGDGDTATTGSTTTATPTPTETPTPTPSG
jgi:hypothetical protein